MRVDFLLQGFLLLCLLFAVNICSGDDSRFEVVGTSLCADCKYNNLKTSQAFSGLHVTIDCKLKNGETKRVANGELDNEGKFKVSLPKELIEDGKKLKEECYAQLHSAAAAPCPAHNGLDASKIVFKTRTNDKHIFGPTKTLQFSAALCTSKLFWPLFNYPPLPKTHPWLKHFGHPFYKKPLPPPVPVYEPPVVKPLPPPIPVYKPPVVKPLPPHVPIYKPKPHPPVPIYKPKPKPKMPIVKPLPPPIPIYKPKPPVYKPKPPVVVKPLPPKPPVYKPPVVIKPLPPKPPVYKPPVVIKPLPPKPPVYKPPVVVEPLPPLVPLYKPPLIPINPLPPKKPCPPLPKIPPKYFHHPKFGHFPPLPPTIFHP